MYDPVIARFLQEDSYRGDINDPLSLNLYSYVKNEPLMYDDPTGHFFEKLWSKGKELVSSGVQLVKDGLSSLTNKKKETSSTALKDSKSDEPSGKQGKKDTSKLEIKDIVSSKFKKRDLGINLKGKGTGNAATNTSSAYNPQTQTKENNILNMKSIIGTKRIEVVQVIERKEKRNK
jgi:hypothetical protein